jgi:hypothetical protein
MAQHPTDESSGRNRRLAHALNSAARSAAEEAAQRFQPQISALREHYELTATSVVAEGRRRIAAEEASEAGVYAQGVRDAAKAREAQALEVQRMLASSGKDFSKSSGGGSRLEDPMFPGFERLTRVPADAGRSSSAAGRQALEASVAEQDLSAARAEVAKLRDSISFIEAQLAALRLRNASVDELSRLKGAIRRSPAWQGLSSRDKVGFLSAALRRAPFSSALFAYLRTVHVPLSPHGLYPVQLLPLQQGQQGQQFLGGQPTFASFQPTSGFQQQHQQFLPQLQQQPGGQQYDFPWGSNY